MPFFPPRQTPATRYTGSSGRSQFLRDHLWLPLAIAIAVASILKLLNLDFLLADQLYALQGHAWSLRFHPVTRSLIHVGGKYASIAAWLCVAGAYCWSRGDDRLGPWRRPLAYLVVTTVLSIACVGVVKALTHMDCPWDLARYGGDRTFVGLLTPRPESMPRASCFPSGHSSAGYAWVAVYFCLLEVKPRLRWAGLALALGTGTLFGFSQQLRGAHFLSHDFSTLAICWFVAVASHAQFFIRPPRRTATQSEPAAGGAVRMDAGNAPVSPATPVAPAHT